MCAVPGIKDERSKLLLTSGCHVHRCRWGDYSGITMDPDGKTFWVFNAYGQQNNAWGTWLGAYQCQPALQALASVTGTAGGRKLTAASLLPEAKEALTAVEHSHTVDSASPLAKSPMSNINDIYDGGATRSPGGSGCASGSSCPNGVGCSGS